MKPWLIYQDTKGFGLICGECAEKIGESEERSFLTKAVVDNDLYTQKCDFCEKNCGDYYHAKEAA